MVVGLGRGVLPTDNVPPLALQAGVNFLLGVGAEGQPKHVVTVNVAEDGVRAEVAQEMGARE